MSYDAAGEGSGPRQGASLARWDDLADHDRVRSLTHTLGSLVEGSTEQAWFVVNILTPAVRRLEQGAKARLASFPLSVREARNLRADWESER